MVRGLTYDWWVTIKNDQVSKEVLAALSTTEWQPNYDKVCRDFIER